MISLNLNFNLNFSPLEINSFSLNLKSQISLSQFNLQSKMRRLIESEIWDVLSQGRVHRYFQSPPLAQFNLAGAKEHNNDRDNYLYLHLLDIYRHSWLAC